MLYVADQKAPSREAASSAAITAANVGVRGPGALIVGGDCGSLSVIRSLGRHGIPARYVTDGDFLAKSSRYTLAGDSWPGPGHPDALSFLLDLAKRECLAGWLLIPIGDAEVEFVAKNRKALSSTFRLTTPGWDVVKWAVDKKLAYRRAEMLGIPYPRTYDVKSLDDVEHIDFLFPVILKPAKKEEINAFTLAKAWRADDRTQLRERYIQAEALVGPGGIVVQELIPGSGACQFSYVPAYGRMARRRLRSSPGGRVSFPPISAVAALSSRPSTTR